MRTISALLGCQTIQGVDGTLNVNGQQPYDAHNHKRMVSYVDQGDLSLTPILTVEETFRFALECADDFATPAELQDYIDSLLKLSGLDHVAQTVVGNADIRGVSGGQKRRVKLLEQSVGSDTRWGFLDEITNGLDATSALSLCRTLRTAVEATGMSEVIVLLQPSAEVFATFHRVVVLTQHGQVAYSGTRQEAVAHFEQLGFVKPSDMNESEFLLRVTSSPKDFHGSKSAEGTTASILQEFSTASDLAGAFMSSKAGQRLDDELRQAETHNVALVSSKEKQTDFAKSTWVQIGIVARRGLTLMVRNPASLMRIISATIFGIFIGTLFLHTPANAEGTLVRAGYVLTLIFLMFLTACMAPLEDLFIDRLTFYVHRQANFYSTPSYYIGQMVSNLPVGLCEAFLLAALSFFAVGMNSGVASAGFWYFLLLSILLVVCGNAVARLLAYTLPSADIANALGPAVLLFFVLTGGFSPQYMQIPAFLRWVSWLSPCAYAYEGMIINELFNRRVQVGNGDAFVNGNVFGTQAFGIPRVGYTTAPSGLDTPGGVMAFDVYMLLALTIVFDVLACLALHKSQKWYGPTTKRYQVSCGMSLRQAPTMDELDKKFEKLASKNVKTSDGHNQSARGEEDEKDGDNKSATGIPEAPKVHLTARQIVYEVDVDLPPEEKKKTKKNNKSAGNTQQPDTSTTTEENVDTDEHTDAITSKEYGQTGRGAAQEWMLKRRMGGDCLSSKASSGFSSTITNDAVKNLSQEEVLEEGVAENVLELAAPAPGRLRLLSGITSSFLPATMTALMGSSGAGKSTLLDVLAGYKTGGYITGDININSQANTHETWRSIAGYCEQVDLHNPALTVRESITFSAWMRLQPYALPEDVKRQHVQDILELLELTDLADMLVGNEAIGEGLPKHARKRLTVGVELAANPSVLFADEPTSGLDSISASMVVGCLSRAARERGLTVVCTIHQPSKEVFEAFDNLLLLKNGGVCVYNGKVADVETYMIQATSSSSHKAEGSSARTDYALPHGANPADHTLDVFCGPKGAQEDWGKLYNQSSMAHEMQTAFQSCPCDSCASKKPLVANMAGGSSSLGFSKELWYVLSRQLLTHWRTPTYMAVRLWWTIGGTLVTGLVYLNQGNITTEQNLMNVMGAIFFFVNITTVPLLATAEPLISERAVFYREVASGTYGRKIYGIAVQLAELPFNIVAALLSAMIFYPLVGLTRNPESIAYFILMSCAAYWMIPAFGQLLAFCSPNTGAAIGSGSLVMTVFTLTMGFLIPGDDIPPWYIWLYYINPLRYMLQGFVVSTVGANPLVNVILSEHLGWSYTDRWWYCYVAVLIFAAVASLGIVASTRISWLQR
jgi:ABC-type multidrug transport system ATPase subunit